MLTADGADALATTARRAADQLDTVVAEWADDAGAIVLTDVKPPILTGALAATVHVIRTERGFGIAAGSRHAYYAALVNARHPFITPALVARQTAVVDQAAEAVDKLLGTIKGA